MRKPGASDRARTLEYTLLTIAVLGLGFGYLALGRFDTVASQILMSGPAVLLFYSHLRFMKNIEGRTWTGLAPAALLIWGSTWAIEAGGVWAGLYHYNGSFLVSLRLGPVPVLIPSIWVLFCWLSTSILHFLSFGLPGRAPRRRTIVGPLVARGLATGWVMLSMAFAVEWHLSKTSGLWTWEATVSGRGIDGVPWYNFYLWFAVGFLSSFFDRIGLAPTPKYQTRTLWLRALPVIGFGLVLLVNSGLNAVRGYAFGAVFGAGSLLVLALLSLRAVRAMKSEAGAQPPGASIV